MAKVLIIYYSRTGNTQEMAESVAEGARKVGTEVEVKKVEATAPEDLLAADAVIVGSPTYYGLPAFEIKELFDRSVQYHGKLQGKIGGAFSSSANIGGGNETTIMSIIQMLLIHGMIVPGESSGDHYGPVSVGKPDKRVKDQCIRLGEKIARLAQKMQEPQ